MSNDSSNVGNDRQQDGGAVPVPAPVPETNLSATNSPQAITDLFLLRFVVITATMVASAIAIGVIFIAMLMPFLSDKGAPEEVTNWGGIIIGFYFGTFASLLKDWITGKQTKG